MIGLRLLTVEPRITAAAFGPIPARVSSCFEAFASAEKALHVHPGRHNRLPDHAHHAMARFYARHLGRTV